MAGKRFMLFAWDYGDKDAQGLGALIGTFSTKEGFEYERDKGMHQFYSVYDSLKGEEVK
jgi:hypothetical protein